VIKGRPVELTIDKGIIIESKPEDFDYLVGERYYSEQYLMKI
jgi:phosphopantothenate synthetase